MTVKPRCYEWQFYSLPKNFWFQHVVVNVQYNIDRDQKKPVSTIFSRNLETKSPRLENQREGKVVWRAVGSKHRKAEQADLRYTKYCHKTREQRLNRFERVWENTATSSLEHFSREQRAREDPYSRGSGKSRLLAELTVIAFCFQYRNKGYVNNNSQSVHMVLIT